MNSRSMPCHAIWRFQFFLHYMKKNSYVVKNVVLSVVLLYVSRFSHSSSSFWEKIIGAYYFFLTPFFIFLSFFLLHSSLWFYLSSPSS
jgi:fumarate reductase subunit C